MYGIIEVGDVWGGKKLRVDFHTHNSCQEFSPKRYGLN